MSDTEAADTNTGPRRSDASVGVNTLRAALVGDARAVLGTRRYAERMGVAVRTIQSWASNDPTRPVTLKILRETRELLAAHRQKIGELIRTIRAAEDEGDR